MCIDLCSKYYLTIAINIEVDTAPRAVATSQKIIVYI